MEGQSCDELTADVLPWDGQSTEWAEMADAIKLGAALLPAGDDARRAEFHGLTVAQLHEYRTILGREPRSDELLGLAARVRPHARWRSHRLAEIFPPLHERRAGWAAELPRMWTLPNGDEMSSVELGRLLHREWKDRAFGADTSMAADTSLTLDKLSPRALRALRAIVRAYPDGCTYDSLESECNGRREYVSDALKELRKHGLTVRRSKGDGGGEIATATGRALADNS